MARLSEQEIALVRSRASIVDVISHYISLSKKGRNYVALCPFHDDHNPSMSISEDKQIYKCFVCGAGGNVFTFVSNYEKISFLEAVYKVACYPVQFLVLREQRHLYLTRVHCLYCALVYAGAWRIIAQGV